MAYKVNRLSGALVALAAVCVSSRAVALPFNDDLVDSQLRTGTMMRPKSPDSVSVGMSKNFVANKEEALALSNPLSGDSASALRGKRLFSVNCSPCHGNIEVEPYEPGPSGKLMGAPNITDPMFKVKPDGHYYGIIHFGGMATMPAYGWKLSPTEHWDIVNYIRKVQNRS